MTAAGEADRRSALRVADKGVKPWLDQITVLRLGRVLRKDHEREIGRQHSPLLWFMNPSYDLRATAALDAFRHHVAGTPPASHRCPIRVGEIDSGCGSESSVGTSSDEWNGALVAGCALIAVAICRIS